ncbi:hypothetical protein [Lysobacter sp. Root604]|uniref:hypothetical protein n=1 Tax=Lysobacter sp. Root604 TaxID=1736568 RepID=UPI000700878C|nr:hypothetical protein [Lysobacter sp. Root604]KRA15353.1 hypothetical protein ASD69_17925 [Lysobacter sp. Root604]
MSPRAILALIFVALLAAIGFGAAFQQSRIAAAKADTAKVQQQLLGMTSERDTALQERNHARSNVLVVTKFVDRVQKVHVAGATITKEIPIYVTPKADAACTLTAGFVRIHDAAAGNVPPDASAGDPDAPAAGLTLSAVADTVAGNYTACHVIREQVIGLQDYVNSLPASAPQ